MHDRDVDVEGRTGKHEVVTKVSADSAFRVGDVLLSVNGVPVDGHAALFDVLGSELIGQKTPIVVWRDGERVEFAVVPERLPERLPNRTP